MKLNRIFNKMKIRSKFNIIIIFVILFLVVVLGLVSKNQVEKRMMKIYEERITVESKQALEVLDKQYPGSWAVKGDELYKGNVLINNKNKILDEIGETTGGLANIFLNNSTVATNVIVDGKRRIGASADPAIAEVVLEKGKAYVGKADISGSQYLTIYQPIKDENGQVIGMWLVGTSIETIQESVRSLVLTIIITIALAGIIAILITIFFTRSVVRPINAVKSQLREIAEGEGDLTKEIIVNTQDEIGEMALSFNKMLRTLRSMLNQVSETSEQVAASSEELLSSAEQTSSATNQVVLSIQEVAHSIEIQGNSTIESAEVIKDITHGMQQVSESIGSVAIAANDTMNQANAGNDYIREVVGQVRNIYDASMDTLEVMKNLESNSNEIGKIIDVITGIAQQTNLLALNAAIEAARAAEHGKGFAVVADEVRKLAEQSKESADQIVEIIKFIQGDIETAVNKTVDTTHIAENGLKLTEETGKAFGQILKSIEGVSAKTQELSTITEEITANIEQMNASINEIAEIANKNTTNTTEIASASEEQLATMEEVTSSANALAAMAEKLQILVNRFKI